MLNTVLTWIWLSKEIFDSVTMMMNKDMEDVIGCLPIQLEAGHRREMLEIVDRLPATIAQGATASSLACARFQDLVQLYSGEPSLLDPVLHDLVGPLLSYITWPADGASPSHDSSSPSPLSALSVGALNLLQMLMRVRGYKYLMRFLPHEVTYLKPLVACLEHYSRFADVTEANANASLVFVLSVWLMIICKNPFNLAKFDRGGAANSDDALPVADRIVNCMTRLQGHYYLPAESSIISNLLAQILTRNQRNLDVIMPHVDGAIAVIRAFDSETDGGGVLISKLRLLNSLFKHGKRRELKECANRLVEAVLDRLLGVNCDNTFVRTLVVKLLQRIAFTLLRPRLADWRYRCGHRSIEESLRNQAAMTCSDKPPVEAAEGRSTAQQNGTDTEEDDDGDEEVPYELIEKLIDELLAKIHDRDGVTRWAAAKGVARICARLPKALGGEVVSAVLRDSFADFASATTWHGGCLAVAELCRRGCLLPEHVPEVVERVLKRALFFDGSLEAVTLGVGVRDAACYICWAFARGYERGLLRDCLPAIAEPLVCLALFDREINIRRAASAAFQENVGRNNCFPHGIQVLTLIGYTDVTLIHHSYLELSRSVAAFPEYRRPIIEHLTMNRSVHWDESLRELAADALELLAPIDADYCRDEVLPMLCRRLANKDAAVKHGTLFAIAGVLRGLMAAGINVQDIDGDGSLRSYIHNNLGLIENHRVGGFRLLGKGFSRLIGAICAVRMPITDEQLDEYHNVLDQMISDKNERLHPPAIAAFEDLMRLYESERFTSLLRRIHNNYFVKMRDTTAELTRLSAVHPLAQISAPLLAASVDNDADASVESGLYGDVTLCDAILARLVDVIKDPTTPKWAFTRVAAIRCISSILTKFTPPNLRVTLILETLIAAAEDYTTTTNGDIGRFTRREAVLAIVRILPIAIAQYNHHPDASHPLDPLLAKAVQAIVTRCCEAIDDLRAVACVAMADLLRTRVHPAAPLTSDGDVAQGHHPDGRSLNIPERRLLEEIFFVDEPPNSSISGRHSLLSTHSAAATTTAETTNGAFIAADWSQARGYVRLQPLLRSPHYGLSALDGFVLSAGSIAAWTSQSAYDAIYLHVKTVKKDRAKLEAFIDDLLRVYERIVARKGTTAPVFQLLWMLLNDRAFAIFESDTDSSPSFTALTDKVFRVATGRGTKKIKRMAICVLGAFLLLRPTSALYRRAVSMLISFLSSPYSDSRDVALEQLFNAIDLVEFGTAAEEEERKARMKTLLTTCPWSEEGREDEQKAASAELKQLFLPE